MRVRWTKLIGEETSPLVNFITRNSEPAHEATMLVRARSKHELVPKATTGWNTLIQLERFNNISQLNEFLAQANRHINMQGRFICCAETLEQRKKRHLHKYGALLNRIIYPFDFLLKRVFPKLSLSRAIYFKITGGRNRALSKTEILGRLVFAGFEIEKIEELNGLLYIVSKKVAAPSTDSKPSHGMILSINRIGANGKKIKVYKLRTMHPYAQYVQDYIYKQHALEKGGKFKNDFRITKWGRWMRKFWIDEIPMIYNIICGDLKLVGVRPLSPHYLSLYTNEHRVKRLHSKPGLIPPFYADLPVTINEIMDSESRYIDTYDQNGWRADLDYVVKAFNNILLKSARSA